MARPRSLERGAGPIPQVQSLWEIVPHMIAREDVVRRRLLGESPELAEEENWPTLGNPGPADWTRALAPS